jgi:hypothetical protein
MLALRGWALAALAGVPAAPPPAASPGSWEAFLLIERCALPLRLRGAASVVGSGAEASIVDRHGLRETQRVLSAGEQLAAIARLSRERGWKPVALKSARLAIGPPRFDLYDMDLLLEGADGDALVATLRERGYREVGATASTVTLAPSRAGVPVDLHRALEPPPDPSGFRDRAAPLEELAGVWRLAPADHLAHHLAHMTIRHPERRGRIRDLLILADGLSELSPGEREELPRRVARPAERTAVAATIAAAERIAAGTWRRDPFADDAAALYWAATRLRIVDRWGVGAYLRDHALRYRCAPSVAAALARDLGAARRARPGFSFALPLAGRLLAAAAGGLIGLRARRIPR